MQKGREGPGGDGEEYAAVFDNENRGASQAPSFRTLALHRAGNRRAGGQIPGSCGTCEPVLGIPGRDGVRGKGGQCRTPSARAPRAQRGARVARVQFCIVGLDFLWAHWRYGCADAPFPQSGARGWKRSAMRRCGAGPGPLAPNCGQASCSPGRLLMPIAGKGWLRLCVAPHWWYLTALRPASCPGVPVWPMLGWTCSRSRAAPLCLALGERPVVSGCSCPPPPGSHCKVCIRPLQSVTQRHHLYLSRTSVMLWVLARNGLVLQKAAVSWEAQTRASLRGSVQPVLQPSTRAAAGGRPLPWPGGARLGAGLTGATFGEFPGHAMLCGAGEDLFLLLVRVHGSENGFKAAGWE